MAPRRQKKLKKFIPVLDLSSSDSSSNSVGALNLPSTNSVNETSKTAPTKIAINDEIKVSNIYTGQDKKFMTERQKILAATNFNVEHLRESIKTSEDDVENDNSFLLDRAPSTKLDIKSPTYGHGSLSSDSLSNSSSDIELIDLEEDSKHSCKRQKKSPKKTSRARSTSLKEETTTKEVVSLHDSLNLDDFELSFEMPVRKSLIVKIRCKDQIEKITMLRDEEFSTILPTLAERLQTIPECLLILLRDETIAPSETPDSINLSVVDILKCIVLAQSLPQKTNTTKDPNMIEIFIQAKNEKKKTSLPCHKGKPLQNLLDAYAELKNLDPSSLSFNFDGEKVNLEESPDDLEIDDGFCIDVIVH